jgi:hypothetical protein
MLSSPVRNKNTTSKVHSFWHHHPKKGLAPLSVVSKFIDHADATRDAKNTRATCHKSHPKIKFLNSTRQTATKMTARRPPPTGDFSACLACARDCRARPFGTCARMSVADGRAEDQPAVLALRHCPLGISCCEDGLGCLQSGCLARGRCVA